MTQHALPRRCPATSVASLLAVTAALVLALMLPAGARGQAQDAVRPPEAVRNELMGQFEGAMARFIALAEAMPDETYTWSPGEGVMETGQVYMHVARYNYLYPSENMDAAAVPAGVDMEGMEAVRDKAAVLSALRQSRDWVRGAVGSLDAAALDREVSLYGREVPNWAVLVQLVTHMNQHLGQSIAYARMNEVVPPWSR